MSHTMMMLLVLGLVVAAVSARGGHGGGGRGGHGGGRGGGQSGKSSGQQSGQGGGRGGGHRGGRGGMRGLVCNVIDTSGLVMTKTCLEGTGECNLGPLEYLDTTGAVTRTVKFCDGLDDAGTSLVAARACLIKDSTQENILVDNSANMKSKNGVAPTCDLEVAITYENAAAFAYFPTKTCTRTTTVEEEDEEEVEIIDP